MEITILAIPSIILGVFLGLVTRNLGTLGLLALIFLLCVISGSNSFSSRDSSFFILLGSVLTHAAPIPALQRLIDWMSRIRLRRLYRGKKTSSVDVETDRDNASPNVFWGSVQSLSDTPKDTEPMSDEFWTAVESSTKKADSESDDSSSHT